MGVVNLFWKIFLTIKQSREVLGIPSSKSKVYLLKVVSAFRETREYTMGELSRNAYVNMPSMTEMVKKLEKEGIVHRARSAEDHRVVKVRLTDKGLEIHRKLCQTRSKALQDIFCRLSENDRAELTRSMQNVFDILSKVV